MAFFNIRMPKRKISSTTLKLLLVLYALLIIYYAHDFSFCSVYDCEPKPDKYARSTIMSTLLSPNPNFKISKSDSNDRSTTNINSKVNVNDISSSINNKNNDNDKDKKEKKMKKRKDKRNRAITEIDYTKYYNFKPTCNRNELKPLEYFYVNGGEAAIDQRLNKPSTAITCPRILRQANFNSPRTWLLSLPGSGNTWMRHLLHQLTGIPTGAIYKDNELRDDGFPYENRTDHVIAIKAYSFSVIERRSPFILRPTTDRLIVLIRSPYSTLMADYKRSMMHLGHTGNDVINPEKATWKEYMRRKVPMWARLIRQTVQSKLEKIFVFYEDLRHDRLHQLLRLSTFLKNKSLTEFAFCCTMNNSHGDYHRPPSNQTEADVYTKKDKQDINSALVELADEIYATDPKVAERLLGYVMYL